MTSQQETERPQRIAALSDQQVLSIVDSLAAQFISDDAPEGSDEQADALGVWLRDAGFDIDMHKAVEADPAAAAAAGRQLLLLVGDVPEVQDALDGWLANPPVQEAAAIPLVLAAPVVLTMCVAFLELVESIRFQRDRDGTWMVSIGAGGRRGKGSASQLVAGLAKVMNSLSGGGTT